MKKRNKKVCPEHNQRVFVAMSGGVDSSVTAGLLKQKGYQVTGVFWRLFPGQSKGAAKSVAKKLGIPFLALDFRKEFKKEVIDYFLKEYARGRTPNPCVVCNQKIKFGLFLKEALKRRAGLIATGHYVRKFPIPNSQFPIFKLLIAKDKEKDQSYFLWRLTQKQLARILFPLGNYTKQEVYQLAKKWGLPHRSEESFDICFLAGQDHNQFLKRYLKLKPGPIIDTQGRKIGQHQGLPLYTIGQRRELGIGGPGPYYVVEMDYQTNILIVTDSPFDQRLYKKSLIATQVNWISGIEPKLPLKIKASIRYRHQAVPATIKKTGNTLSGVVSGHPFGCRPINIDGCCPINMEGCRPINMEGCRLININKYRLININKYRLINIDGCRLINMDDTRKGVIEVVFKTPQRAITPGQSVVFYKGKELVGGGLIC